ncbi:glycyl radical enzyme domain-containing protein [Tissierella praeacuta]|uniref:glycyl radical enzyme domain-containing protein n=1 Tax=Tissierella praeacuta TaxID=43131 RepID=UPI002FDB304E
MFKGGFEVGARYLSAYRQDGDLVRVSGYLVKKSDLERLKNGLHVNYGNIRYGKEQILDHNILDRMVRTTDE